MSRYTPKQIVVDGNDNVDVGGNLGVGGDLDVVGDTTLAGAIISGIIVTPTTQHISGSGAVSLVTAITTIQTASAASALTLADGVEGQEKFLFMTHELLGTATLTPTNLATYATLTFDDVGESAHIMFVGGMWVFMGGTCGRNV